MLNVRCAILAGGRSSRLGQDKRFLSIRGRTCFQRALDAVAELDPAPFLLVRDEEDARQLKCETCTILTDPLPGEGPLAALANALDRLDKEWLLLLAVDYPLVTPFFLKRMTTYAERDGSDSLCIVPCEGEMPHVTCALYSKLSAAACQKFVDEGGRSIQRWIRTLSPISFVDESIWGRWGAYKPLLNLNTVADLAALESLDEQGYT